MGSSQPGPDASCPAWRRRAAWRRPPSSTSPSTRARRHLTRLGDPDRDGHRLCARRARPAGLARADLAQDLPDRARHHRRPRGRGDHRSLLHDRPVARSGSAVRADDRRPGWAQPSRRSSGWRPILALGAVLWFVVLKSGVHATLAGVALALTIPLRPSPGRPDDPASPLHILEHALHPWVAFLIVPVFGFANAGDCAWQAPMGSCCSAA